MNGSAVLDGRIDSVVGLVRNSFATVTTTYLIVVRGFGHHCHVSW